MSSSFVSNLRGVVERTQQLTEKLPKVHPSAVQLETLSTLSQSLTHVAALLQQSIDLRKEERKTKAWKESEGHRAQADALRAGLLMNGELQSSSVFRRNILLIFEGPKISAFDSEQAKTRKEFTRKRCDRLRELSVDGLISFSIGVAPTVWARGAMGEDVFDCFIQAIEPEEIQEWPRSILEILYKLKDDEPFLQTSSDFQKFLAAFETHIHEASYGGPRKRVRTAEEIAVTEPVVCDSSNQLSSREFEDAASSPSKENREMQHMYTNAPIGSIPELPEPFRTAVENSKLWKWERAQRGLETTSCIATLFPKDNTQDVSITIWCGNDDGYHVNNIFSLQHAVSS